MTTHTHKLKRLKYKSGNIIYFCTLPDCNYKINIALALGKRSICWRCGEPFIMDDYSLRLAKPHCESCHRPKVDMPVYEEVALVQQSLSDRLSQTIQAAQQTEEDDEL